MSFVETSTQVAGLTPSEERIAQRVAELVRAAPLAVAPAVAETDVIFTRAEAKAYVKRTSEGAFSAWCSAWQYRPAGRGRHSKQALDRALDREARRRG